VALVAIDAVVDIAGHVLVIGISGRLRMAIRALKDGVVTWIGVASCADAIGVTVACVEPSVVESCARPAGNNLMAGLARGWESRCNVVGIVRGQIDGFMTRVTIGWKRGVVVVHVAVSALDGCVRAHQREGCVVVVKRGRLPRSSAVANIALLREVSRHVIGVRCVLVVLQVATHAGRAGQVVVAVLVAVRALELQVPAGQRKAALGVIERGRLPGRRAVANGAVGGKSGGDVIRIRRSLIGLHVARGACRTRQIEVSVSVAIGALQFGVGAAQGKSHSAVIEVGRLPSGRVVAILAGLGEAEPNVVGVGCFAKIRHVTAHAVRRRSFVPAAHVASQTVEVGVRSGQGEAGHFQVIEGGAEPGGDRVALLATGREPCRRVAGRIRLLIGGRVAGVALERQSLKLADGRSLVAAVALQ